MLPLTHLNYLPASMEIDPLVSLSSAASATPSSGKKREHEFIDDAGEISSGDNAVHAERKGCAG